MRLQGIVSTFITHKKFGFIHYPEGDIFFHELDVIDGPRDGSILQRGDRVEFEMGEYQGRTKAVNVQRIAVTAVKS
jgi:cold shock CspA family protein